MSETSHAARGGNGYGEQIQSFLDRIGALDDELLSLRASYMNECKGPRGRIRDVLLEVRESSINTRAFRELLQQHRDERRRQARVDALEADDRDAYDVLIDALGPFAATPLGQAALDRAKPRQEGDETLRTLG